ESGRPGDSFPAGPIGDPSPVGRKPRIPAPRRQQHGIAAQSGHDVDPAAALFRSEGYPRSVRREARITFVGGIAGEAYGLAPADLLQPDIEVALLVPVRCEGDQLSI